MGSEVLVDGVAFQECVRCVAGTKKVRVTVNRLNPGRSFDLGRAYKIRVRVPEFPDQRLRCELSDIEQYVDANAVLRTDYVFDVRGEFATANDE